MQNNTQIPRERKGPATQRLLILTLNCILAILIFWLLGFIIDDIGNQPGPDYNIILKQYQNQTLVKQKESLGEQDRKLSTQIDNAHQQQNYLQSSIGSYKDTTNQLLDLQKASLQKGVSFPEQSQQNLTRATNLYLEYQQKFQDLNRIISANNLALQQVRYQINQLDTQLSKQAEKANDAYQHAYTVHNYYMAVLKLLVLLPMLLFVIFIFKKYRNTIYKNMIIATGIAIVLKIAEVMHEHFPSRFFKYILIFVLIYFVVRALMYLLKNISSPKKDWLLAQFKEAYQKLLCPECQYPIQPGIMKFFTFRNQQLEKNMVDTSYLQKIDQYNCPSCGERLYEKCEHCQNTRHSLLTYCDHCGAEK